MAELLPQSFLPFNIVQRGRSTRMHRNLLNCILGMLMIGFSSLRHRMAGPLCKEEARLCPDASFRVGFYCFALHWLNCHPPYSFLIILLKTKVTLIEAVSRALPVWSVPAHLFFVYASSCDISCRTQVVNSGVPMKAVATGAPH